MPSRRKTENTGLPKLNLDYASVDAISRLVPLIKSRPSLDITDTWALRETSLDAINKLLAWSGGGPRVLPRAHYI